MDQLRLMMAEEEKERAELGTTYVHSVSASAFLLLGIEIETLQLVRIHVRPIASTNHHQPTGKLSAPRYKAAATRPYSKQPIWLNDAPLS